MIFYESIANQGMQTSAGGTFIETSGECAMYCDQEVRCVNDTRQPFGDETAQSNV